MNELLIVFIIVIIILLLSKVKYKKGEEKKRESLEVGHIIAQPDDNATNTVDPVTETDEYASVESNSSELVLPPIPVSPVDFYNVYNQWNTNQGYTECYKPIPWDVNNCNIYERMDIDEKNSQHWRAANRDKKIIEGWASKNADYFRKNYYNELEKEESKRWWGRDEY